MKYGRLVVFIRHDSAEIWGFTYGLTHVFGTLKIMPSTLCFRASSLCSIKDKNEKKTIHIRVYRKAEYLIILAAPFLDTPYSCRHLGLKDRTGNRFARDKEPGPSWGKQLPGEWPRETAET